MDTHRHVEEEMRITKMMAEGGPMMEDNLHRGNSVDTEELAAKSMVSEGGLGADMYYVDEQRVN